MKRINESIGKKVFLITLAFLVVGAIGIYLIISIAMPIQYRSYVNRRVEEDGKDFLTLVENEELTDASAHINEFATERECYILIARKGIICSQAPSTFWGDSDESLKKYLAEREDENSPYWMNDTSLLHPDKDLFAAPFGIYYINAIMNEYESGEQNVFYLNNKHNACECVTWSRDGEEYGAIIVRTLSEINNSSDVLLELFTIVFVGIVLLSLLGAFIYTRWLTSPLIKISRTAQKMSEMHLDERCGIESKDEIGLLSRSIDEMAEKLSENIAELQNHNVRLQQEFEREQRQDRIRRDFFNMASHELKTPLTVLRGYLEGMIYHIGVYEDRDKYLDSSLTKVEEMEFQVQELLEIARMEKQFDSTKNDNISVKQMLMKSCRSMESIIENKKLHVDNAFSKEETSEIVIAQGNEKLLQRVIDNVIKNAIDYSPEKASIVIQRKETQDGSYLSIENEGAHIKEEDLERIFEPFYRGEDSQGNCSGNGLGLYIVRNILELHQLTCSINNTECGVEFLMSIKEMRYTN